MNCPFCHQILVHNPKTDMPDWLECTSSIKDFNNSAHNFNIREKPGSFQLVIYVKDSNVEDKNIYLVGYHRINNLYYVSHSKDLQLTSIGAFNYCQCVDKLHQYFNLLAFK